MQQIETENSCTHENTPTNSNVKVDATANANSGHPGAPMGMAPISHVLFNKFMQFNPKNSDWINRDRFVLS